MINRCSTSRLILSKFKIKCPLFVLAEHLHALAGQREGWIPRRPKCRHLVLPSVATPRRPPCALPTLPARCVSGFLAQQVICKGLCCCRIKLAFSERPTRGACGMSLSRNRKVTYLFNFVFLDMPCMEKANKIKEVSDHWSAARKKEHLRFLFQTANNLRIFPDMPCMKRVYRDN